MFGIVSPYCLNYIINIRKLCTEPSLCKLRIFVRKSPEKSFWQMKPGNKNFGKKIPIF